MRHIAGMAGGGGTGLVNAALPKLCSITHGPSSCWLLSLGPRHLTFLRVRLPSWGYVKYVVHVYFETFFMFKCVVFRCFFQRLDPQGVGWVCWTPSPPPQVVLPRALWVLFQRRVWPILAFFGAKRRKFFSTPKSTPKNVGPPGGWFPLGGWGDPRSLKKESLVVFLFGRLVCKMPTNLPKSPRYEPPPRVYILVGFQGRNIKLPRRKLSLFCHKF